MNKGLKLLLLRVRASFRMIKRNTDLMNKGLKQYSPCSQQNHTSL